MLSDLQNESNNNNFANNNQINRTEIIYEVQKDFQEYNLIGITTNTNTDEIKFYYNDNKTSVINMEIDNGKYYINYTSVDGFKTKWEMKDAMFGDIQKENIRVENSEKFAVKITIPIYNNPINENNYSDKNNAIDDIEITYVGLTADIDNNITNNFLNN